MQLTENRRLPSLLAGPAVLLVAVALIVTACQGATSSPGGSPAAGAGQTSEVAAATDVASPAAPETELPSQLAEIDVDLLPQASFDPKKVEVACDPPPSGSESQALSCDDALAIAMRLMKSETQSVVKQVHIVRAECASSPCTADELQTVTIVGFAEPDPDTPDTPVIVKATIYGSKGTATFPEAAPDETFPTPS